MFRHMKWSKAEKKVARRAYDLAYRRECEALIKEVKARSRKVAEPDELWSLADYLWAHRQEIDDKYDYRYSVLPLVFARLASESWLSLADLEGLDPDKLATIEGLLGPNDEGETDG